MDEQALRKAFRNAWLLVLAAAVFVVVFVVFAIRTNTPPKTPTWEMGGVSFVPASSQYGNGYYNPARSAVKGDGK